jgi:hypothetical protein
MASDRPGHRPRLTAFGGATGRHPCRLWRVGVGAVLIMRTSMGMSIACLPVNPRSKAICFSSGLKSLPQRCFSTTLPAVTWKANTMNSGPLAINAMANGQAPTCQAIMQLARRGLRRADFTERSSKARSPAQSLKEAKDLLRRAGANDLLALPRRRAPSR